MIKNTLLFITIIVLTISVTIVKSQYMLVQQFSTTSSKSCDSNGLQQGWISKINVCSQYYMLDYLYDVPITYVEESKYIVENQYESSDIKCEGSIVNSTRYLKDSCNYLTTFEEPGYNGDFKFSTMSSLDIPSNSLLTIYYRFPCGKSLWKYTFTAIQYQLINVCQFQNTWNSTSISCDSQNQVETTYGWGGDGCTGHSTSVSSEPLIDQCGGYLDDFNLVQVCNN